jgi:hypothetical protein
MTRSPGRIEAFRSSQQCRAGALPSKRGTRFQRAPQRRQKRQIRARSAAQTASNRRKEVRMLTLPEVPIARSERQRWIRGGSFFEA